MLGWFQALMPKEERFFDFFARHATIVVAAAEAMRGLLLGGARTFNMPRCLTDGELMGSSKSC